MRAFAYRWEEDEGEGWTVHPKTSGLKIPTSEWKECDRGKSTHKRALTQNRTAGSPEKVCFMRRGWMQGKTKANANRKAAVPSPFLTMASPKR